MTSRRPRGWAVFLVRLATGLIPPGHVRDRYRAELTAELWGMTTRQQLAHGVSALAAAPALHRALYECRAIIHPHSRLWCRCHLHHDWHVESTEDGSRYRRCLACGMDDDGLWLPHSESGIGVILRGPPQ